MDRRGQEVGETSGRNNWNNKNKSFVDVVNNTTTIKNGGDVMCILKHTTSEEARTRFCKAYVGKVAIAGSTNCMQSKLEIDGYFNVKLTSLGGSLCILEESKEGVIKSLIEEGEIWWKNCFKDVMKWEDGGIEQERMVESVWHSSSSLKSVFLHIFGRVSRKVYLHR